MFKIRVATSREILHIHYTGQLVKWPHIVSLSPVKLTGSMELFEFYCLGCRMLCCFCFPPFSQNGNGFKCSFINSTFYSSGKFLISTERHARSRSSPNTIQIHTKTWFCGNESFSHWICFLLLFIHNFILLITAWSLIQVCKGRERERKRGSKRD